MMGLSRELVINNDFATKRDVYYQSKNWEEAKFDDQTESDTVMDDIEALFSVDDVSQSSCALCPMSMAELWLGIWWSSIPIWNPERSNALTAHASAVAPIPFPLPSSI